MKIVVTGSLGHIGRPLAQQLIGGGHSVTVISSSADRQKEIEAMGAKAAIGSMRDVEFLTRAFTGADAAYLMETLGAGAFFDKELDVMGTMKQIGQNYKNAIERSGIKRIVHLSSIGAHTDKGNGILRFHYDVEQILNQLPADVTITTLRPASFYYNVLSFIPMIKSTGVITDNYTTDFKEPWVSTLDIADVAAEEIAKEFTGRKVRYIASDELTGDEVANILGNAIGKPDLKWIAITDEQQQNRMLNGGVNPQFAVGMTEMNAARRTGALFEDYDQHKPILGKIKLTDYAKEFATAYNQQ